jgi:hypothetical protein
MGADAPRRFQFPHCHVEAAIAGQCNDAPARPDTELRADRAGNAITDRSKSAIGDKPATRLLRVKEKTGPMRRKSAVGNEKLRLTASQRSTRP